MHWSSLRSFRSLLPLLLFLVVVASADTIVEDGFYDQISASVVSASVTDQGLSVNGALFFPGFDPSLGYLNSATIDWTAYIGAAEYFYSDTPLYTILPYTVTWTATAALLAPFSSSDSATQSNSGPFVQEDLQSEDFDPFTLSGEAVADSGAALADFASSSPGILTNVIVEDTGTYSSFDFLPSGDFQGIEGQDTGVSFQATVTYDYTPVPEPACGVALLSTALLIALRLKVGKNRVE